MRDWRPYDERAGDGFAQWIGGMIRYWLARRATPEHVAPIADRVMGRIEQQHGKAACPWCATGPMGVRLTLGEDHYVATYTPAKCPVCRGKHTILIVPEAA